MKTLIALLLLLTGSVSAQDALFNYPRSVSSTGGGATSPGGTVTGANQYRTAGGAFGGDDSVIDNGAGLLTAVGVSATTISVTNLMLTSSTLLGGQLLYARLNGAALVMDGAAGHQYNQATNRTIFSETDLTANTTPSATVHVSGTLLSTSSTNLQGVTVIGTAVVSLTTAGLVRKQPGTSSIDGVVSESPNGLVTARMYADSTYAYLDRAGAATSRITLQAGGMGFGSAPTTASLTVAGTISATLLRTNGIVSGGTACLDGQETWSAVYKSKALCVGATWIILASTTTTVSNSGL